MKRAHWVQYSWNLKAFPTEEPALPPSFSIRKATVHDAVKVRAVVFSAFSLDSDWNCMYTELRPLLDSALEELFQEKREPFCLVLTHGTRIIGASGLSADPQAKRHLLTGPCLAMEYRNRGLGLALFVHSLLELKNAGISTVRGLTKSGAGASAFVYSKFNPTQKEPDKETVALAAGK